MRRTRKVPFSVEAANLAKYFPAWTRDQWADMLMPSISGVAIDTVLFSRIGSPLCHQYQLISRTGSHAAFRGTYLRRLRAFLDESDSVAVATPAPVVGQPELKAKEFPTLRLPESPDLLPSFGLSSSSSSPTLPWGTAEDSSPPFSPNRVRERHWAKNRLRMFRTR